MKCIPLKDGYACRADLYATGAAWEAFRDSESKFFINGRWTAEDSIIETVSEGGRSKTTGFLDTESLQPLNGDVDRAAFLCGWVKATEASKSEATEGKQGCPQVVLPHGSVLPSASASDSSVLTSKP